MTQEDEVDTSSEEIRFQYDKLRTEILHNDTLSVQSLAAILLLVAAITGYAFSDKVTPTIPITAFFAASIIISYISLRQNRERVRTTFNIASYLRIFLERKTEHIRWETRLQKFRMCEPHYSYSKYQAYSNSYLWIALMNSVLIGWHFNIAYQRQGCKFRFAHFIEFFSSNTFFVLFSILGLVFTILIAWFAYKTDDFYIKQSVKLDNAWKEILLLEKLELLRENLQKHRKEKGKGPHALIDMIDKVSMTEIPDDPFSEKNNWITEVKDGEIINVKSSAVDTKGKAVQLSPKILMYNDSTDVYLQE